MFVMFVDPNKVLILFCRIVFFVFYHCVHDTTRCGLYVLLAGTRSKELECPDIISIRPLIESRTNAKNHN